VSSEETFPLWDIPTRLFHWGLVVCIPLAWWSAEEENYEVHEWTGYTLLVLVVSRIIWGFVGSRHSRFSDFLAGPGKVAAYVREGASDSAGHNPLGGWSVVVLLLLVLAQAVSGLFNSDDILFSGPLYYAVSDATTGLMGTVHDLAFDGLLVMVALHVVAVLYHQFGRGEKLVPAMVRGRADGRSGMAPAAPLWRFLVVLAMTAGALWLGLEQAPEPVPMW
jgi:cytochrome b